MIVGWLFIYFGNILIVFVVMLFGFGYGVMVGVVGFGLFDILNGYVVILWLIIIEVIILVVMVNLSFKLIGYCEDCIGWFYWVLLVVGFIKIVILWCIGVIEVLMVGIMFKVVMIGFFMSLLVVIINVVVCVIIVLLLYWILV